MDRNGRKFFMVGAGAALGVIAAPAVVTGLVGMVGFGAAGPIAGTLATMWHASIGNVAAGSLFAMCQSVGMGGAIPALFSAAGAAAGAVVGAAASKAADEDDSDDEDDNDNDNNDDKRPGKHK